MQHQSKLASPNDDTDHSIFKQIGKPVLESIILSTGAISALQSTTKGTFDSTCLVMHLALVQLATKKVSYQQHNHICRTDLGIVAAELVGKTCDSFFEVWLVSRLVLELAASLSVSAVGLKPIAHESAPPAGVFEGPIDVPKGAMAAAGGTEASGTTAGGTKAGGTVVSASAVATSPLPEASGTWSVVDGCALVFTRAGLSSPGLVFWYEHKRHSHSLIGTVIGLSK